MATKKKTVKKAPAKKRPALKPAKKAATKGKLTAKATKAKVASVAKAKAKAKPPAKAKAVPKKPIKKTVVVKVTKKVVKKAAPKKAAKASPKAATKPAKVNKVAAKATVTPAPKKVSAVKPVAKTPVPQAKPAAAPAPVKAAVPERPKAPAPKVSRMERVQMEFEVRSAPNVLYDLISTPSGFAEWYCTDVNVRGDQYTFSWPDEEEETTMIGRKLGEVIRFHRNDDEDEASYFEFRIRIDAMTNEVALIVTDHAWPNEVEETRNLWTSQIGALLRVLGA